ncbi:transcription repressor NadR [Paraliobacillus quinghaiensis]|uniref:Transcription repressor NadR n=1 Tax=Paraliobacillus quinghaiensis TaxID=470815 RepID=A0A917TM34_9BACI|nr:transcription repressor NadR [Paraliobacillus quinghaiensis]GGM27412.1 transcription repressor NadR [Paraliobacillus quinghaiensis]
MSKTKKLIGSERRNAILQWLQEENQPLTGTDLADRANVSRQVIVQDISLLKAKDHPIMATSQGYVYLEKKHSNERQQRLIACNHGPEQTQEELECMVDQGVTVKDVIIEHPVYGDLKASIMVSNRREVKQFIEKVRATNAPYLLELTNGVHLHTIEADTNAQLEEAYQKLQQLGIIIEN